MRTGIDSRIGRFEDGPLFSVIEISQRSLRQAIPKLVSELTISRMLVVRHEYLVSRMKVRRFQETIVG
jgi:hypothetical protein